MVGRLLVAALAAVLSFNTGTLAATSDETQYDFIIAGGGTAGLTIADRISAALPNRSVLVVEAGFWNPRDAVYEPPWNNRTGDYFYYSDPVPNLNNRVPKEFKVGKALGGSSATNGQYFDRASRHDYNMWSNFSEASDWSWEGLQPYFKKSVTFHEPSDEVAAEYGYTWDIESAYGGNGPINSSLPPYTWPTTLRSREAWLEVGLEARQECAGGDKSGLCWMAMSQNPWDGSRAHAGEGHYLLINETRTNLHVVTESRVVRVIYSGDDVADQVPVVEIKSDSDGSVYNVTARAEVVISAGAVHSPYILQRSGLGPAALLEEAGIDVVLDLPGVGYNFQDHIAAQYAVSITNDVSPNKAEMDTNDTLYQQSIDEYYLRPAQGPYTQGGAHLGGFPALNLITDEYKNLAAAVRAQIANGSAAQYLPPGAADTVIAGYYDQLAYLADAMENTDQPFLEGWTNGVPQYSTLLHPLSRGSILLNTSDIDGEPIVNFNTINNPIDLDIMVTFLPFYRKIWATDALAGLGVVETSPGSNVTTDAQIREWMVNEGLGQTDYHPCCTAAMGPLDKGGVVGADLRVHGLARLRVADLSVAPLELGAHTQSTGYAIGEKAADLIIGTWS